MNKYFKEGQALCKTLQDAGHLAFFSGSSSRDVYLDKLNHRVAIDTSATSFEVSKLLNQPTHTADPTEPIQTAGCLIRPFQKVVFKNGHNYKKHTRNQYTAQKSKHIRCQSIFYDPIKDTWHDPFYGRDALKNKCVSLVQGDYDIKESPEILLQVPRIAAELDFKCDSDSLDALCAYAHHVYFLSEKQLQKEIAHSLLSTSPSKAIKIWYETHVSDFIFPELNLTCDIQQTHKGSIDLFSHIMLCVDAAPKDHLVLKLSALLHDIAKPWTLTVSDEKGMHFYGHEWAGAQQAKRILTRWGFSNKVIKRVANLIKNHLFEASPHITDAAIRRLLKRVGEKNIGDLLDLRRIDRLGTGNKDISMEKIDYLQTRINTALKGKVNVHSSMD